MLISSIYDRCKSGFSGRSTGSAVSRRRRGLREPAIVDVHRIESLEDRLLLTVDLLNQTVVFNQGSQFPGDFTYWTSSVDSNFTAGGVVYDDFSFSTATQFDTVIIQGLFEAANLAANPAEPNTNAWRVNIWNDNGFGTGPGTALLATEDVLIEDSFGELVALANLGSGAQAPVFNVAIGLADSFEANANTVYWLSVISIAQGANNPVWNWMSGSGDDNGSVQQVSGIAGNLLRSGDRAFRLGQSSPPATPTITAPSAIVDATRPTLTWSSVPGAERYDIWVNVYGSNKLVLRQTNVTGTSFQPTTPLPSGQTYIWTVRAFSSAGTPSEWAAHSKFKVNATLAAPTLTTPKGTVGTTTPQFSWSPISGADHYHLWVNVYGSNATVIYETNVPTASFTPTEPLQAGKTYIWTVRALGANNTGGTWATHTTFTVAAAAGVPTLIAPTGTNTSQLPTFQWSAVSGATYVIWVNVYGSNQLAFRQTGVTTNQFTSPVTLTPGKTYIWTVQAVVDGSGGAWATHKTFRVASLKSQMQLAPLSDKTTLDEEDLIESAPVSDESRPNEAALMLADNSDAEFHVARAEASSDGRPADAADGGSDTGGATTADDVDLVMAAWARLAWWLPERSDDTAAA